MSLAHVYYIKTSVYLAQFPVTPFLVEIFKFIGYANNTTIYADFVTYNHIK